MVAFIAPPVSPPYIALQSQAPAAHVAPLPASSVPIAEVPFFSQFEDITSPPWQEVGCGITSLAMMVNFYKPGAVTVDDLLVQGVAAGAYDATAGWGFDGLMKLAEQYGLTGTAYNFAKLGAKTSLARFKKLLAAGPVMLSVHNKFNPKSPVSHLIVIEGIKNGVAYYNDPAAKTGGKKISLTKLVAAWQKKGLVLRPQEGGGALSAAIPSPHQSSSSR